MQQKFIPVGWFDPNNLPGRNEKCPCNSGKKFKNCHQESVRRSLSIISAHVKIVNKKLVDLAGQRRFTQNGKNGWQFDRKEEGSCITYLFEGEAVLKIDYHDLPMTFNNIFDSDKIANAEVDEITYDECLIVQSKEESHEEKTDM